MHSLTNFNRGAIFSLIPLLGMLITGQIAYGQAGLRESLERLDRNKNGNIDPEEITTTARPYLERIAVARRMQLDRPNSIERWQEAARIYHAFQNGASRKSIEVAPTGSVMPFGPSKDAPLVPEFGLAEVRYPYTQADLDEADRAFRRWDRNKDGFLDREEILRGEWTHVDPFESDFNKDDRLSRLEMAQRYARRRLLSGATGELIRKSQQTNSSGRESSVSDRQDDNRSRWRRDRYSSSYYFTSAVLGRFDRNRNGRLEFHEAVDSGLPFDQLDIDRNGELSREELHTYLNEIQESADVVPEGLPSWFYELDENRDAQVTMQEYASEWTDELVQQFTALDTNNDGVLTVDEVALSKAMVGGNFQSRHAEPLPPRRTVVSEIDVDEDFLIEDIKIQVSITHTYTSHLDGYLVGPDGQRIELFSGVGGSDDHFDQTVFDDRADTSITKARPPFNGSFSPQALVKRQTSLGHFKGKNVKGVWQLVIRGARSDRFGMLHHWALIVKPAEDMLRNGTPQS